MRILHVTPYYEQAWAYGGIPRIATTLARGLVERGHHVTVCTTDVVSARERLRRSGHGRPFSPSAATDSHGVDVRIFPNLSNALAYHLQLFLPIGMDAYLRAHAADFDVAHVHACHNVLGSLAAQHLTHAGVPYILAPNGTAPRIERRRLAKLLFDSTLGRHVMPRAARLLAVAEAERRQFHQLGIGDERIAVIPNPTDLTEFATPPSKGAFRRRFGLSDRPLVMFLGKLTPRKRLDILARAFAQLDRRDATLVIVGNDMGYRAELEHLIDTLGIRARTLLTGLLAGHDRLEALADADVVVYPSKDEIFGLVPIEAILSGTPVIVANDSGCGEVIGRVGAGLIVQQGHVGELAHAIGRMLDEGGSWKQATGDAAGRIRSWFSADAVCAALERLYAETIEPA